MAKATCGHHTYHLSGLRLAPPPRPPARPPPTPRAELIIALASNRPWPWPARRALACCACGPAARVGLVSAGREASADRPPERPAPGAADPLLRTVEEPPPVRGRWHSSQPTLRATLPRPRPRSSLSTPSSLLGSQVRALADAETRPAARLPVRAAAPPPPRARVTAQQRRRHDDEIRQTSSYPCLTALLRRSILRVSRPSPPPSALARPAPGVARTTRPTAHPPSRRLADLEKVHSARRPRRRRLGAPPPRRHARSPRPARGRCIPFAVTPLVRA